MLKFHNKVGFVKEGSLFLNRYYNQEDFMAIKASLQVKSGYTQTIDTTLSVLQEVYEEILKKYTPSEALRFLYLPLRMDDTRSNIADSILLTDCPLLHNGADCRASIKAIFKKDHGRSFINDALSDFMAIDEVDESDQPLTLHEFIEILDKNDIQMEAKWNMIKVYEDYEYYVDLLMDELALLEKIMKPIYNQYQIKFQAFYTFWKTACENNTFFDVMEHSVKVDLHDSEKLVVVPTWMGCNGIYIHAKDSKPESVMAVFLGLFFDDGDFFFRKGSIGKEEVCASLKLLSDPSKYEILQYIKKEAFYGSQLAEHVGVTTATISYHVNALSNVGLLILEKDSNRIYYRSNKEQLGFLLDQLRMDLIEE